MSFSDWWIAAHVGAVLIAGTLYLFLHSSDGTFMAWCGFAPAITGLYHWFVLRDSKTPDAP